MKVLRVLCIICALVAACTQSELGAAPASAGAGGLGGKTTLPSGLVASPSGSVASPSASPAGGGAKTGTTTVPPTLKPAPSAHSTLAQLIGQKLIVRMQGLTPSAGLLDRIRGGEVGGVILFGENVTTPAALVQLIETLRAAAAAGDQPRLLIAVDQEGGPIKRIPWAPPTLSPTQMGTSGSTSVARTQGADAGAALRALGVDVDFAPVADVPASTSSFMYKAGRTFSFSATTTAAVSDAFASGLETAQVAPSMKHFPGLGYATRDTDSYVVTITASKTALAPGLKPYTTAIGHHIPMIMLSNATYPAYDSANAAGWSHAIGLTLLRGSMGFTGVTITDSLDGAAKARGVSTASLAIRAAAAGTDMILISGTEASTAADYTALLNAVKAGTIPLAGLQASYKRILALKASL
jgi:beta-N-acetylhexosaminidase